MAKGQMTMPRFSGDEDKFCVWYLRARGYATRFDFISAMGPVVDPNLPANEGPGVGVDQQAAVKRNMKAATFLMEAMPNSEVINIMAAGTADAAWPNQPKAHLMMAYLRETYKNNTTLSRVAAKRDLEKCTMKKDEDPKVLFKKLTAVQFKYQGNVRANITKDDLVTQAVQALPAIYNSTVAGLYERLPNAVTFAALRRAVGNHYSITMKGKSGNKTKYIKGGFAAMETQGAGNYKDSLKKMIKDTINTTIWEYQVKANTGSGNQLSWRNKNSSR
jgi:gag-polypeptide of LTR copia-type